MKEIKEKLKWFNTGGYLRQSLITWFTSFKFTQTVVRCRNVEEMCCVVTSTTVKAVGIVNKAINEV